MTKGALRITTEMIFQKILLCFISSFEGWKMLSHRKEERKMTVTQICIHIVFWDAGCGYHMHIAGSTCIKQLRTCVSRYMCPIASLKKSRQVLTRSTVSFFISSKEISEAMMDQESKEERKRALSPSISLPFILDFFLYLSISSNSISLLRLPK